MEMNKTKKPYSLLSLGVRRHDNEPCAELRPLEERIKSSLTNMKVEYQSRKFNAILSTC